MSSESQKYYLINHIRNNVSGDGTLFKMNTDDILKTMKRLVLIQTQCSNVHVPARTLTNDHFFCCARAPDTVVPVRMSNPIFYPPKSGCPSYDRL